MVTATEIWAEVWTRPGDASYGRVRNYVPFRAAWIEDAINRIEEGNFILPNSWEGFDDLLLTDPDTPANSVSSTVKVFSKKDSTTPILEWFPNEILPEGDKGATTTRVTGIGLKALPAHARLEAYDWDGSDDFAPAQPDWQFGASANLVANPGFEEGSITPKQFHLTITATGGTYTLTDGTDTTSAIAFNAMAATIETRIETDLGLFTDVIVVQIGTSPTTFLIEMVDPPLGVNLGINTGSLTGGTGTTVTVEEGVRGFGPWTKAQTLAQGIPKTQGSYDQDPVVSSNQNHTPGGTYSLFVDPGAIGATSNRLPGVQQVLRVQPGALHQFSVWVYPLSATDRFRLGLFTVGEEQVAWNSSNGVTLTANTWNEITLTDVLMPEGVDQIIMRVAIANAGPYNPSGFYVDDGFAYEGLEATTIGEIIRLIYEHAIDPSLRTPIVWDDGSATNTPFLTLDFSDTLDSNGNAWTHSELVTKLTMRQSYSQIMANLAKEFGYEYRIVADDVETGTYLWQIYNPGTMQTDYTTAAGPAIQGGATDTARSWRRQSPPGTDVLVEGLDRVTSRARNAGLVTALGRIEAAVLSREAPDLTATALAAAVAAAQSVEDLESVEYTLVDPDDEPLSDYRVGDLLTIIDPPDISDIDRRFISVGATITPTGTEWVTDWGSVMTIDPNAAVADAVAGLVTKFEYPFPDQEGGLSIGGGAGGAFTIQVASSEATDIDKQKADLVCTGTDDHETINDALNQIGTSEGRVLLSPGRFYIEPDQIFAIGENIHLQGSGRTVTLLVNQSAGFSNSELLLINTEGEVSDLGFSTTTGASAYAGTLITNSYGTVRNISHVGGNANIGIDMEGGQKPQGQWYLFGNYATCAIFVDEGNLTLSDVVFLTSGGGSGKDFMHVDSSVVETISVSNVVVSNIGTVGNGIVFEDAGELNLNNVSINVPGIGIHADGWTPFHMNIDNVLIDGATTGILVENGGAFERSNLSNIIIVEPLEVGIDIGALRSNFSNVIVYRPGHHGVAIRGASENTFRNVVVIEPGRTTDNTYDGFFIEGNSDANDLQGCRVIPAPSAGNQTRYGINISAATCNDNVVHANFLGDSSEYGTADSVDSGTGTQTTPTAGVIGGQFAY